MLLLLLASKEFFLFIFQFSIVAVTPCELLSIEKQDFFFIFGEEKDEAAPIIQKLLSMYTSRRKNTVNLLKK